ncbi:hypothetical protein HETIRDRAFT_306069 [Heterobasidion irregulare TC 32-1]|uniref:Uncharacterized protein n=1 Tax=Heterobasidion irregulare (strain TC 32-1) TaxID=747525 RepID=W4KKX2_HETIT|nr:uncharacterized protein HETIRDRAFT_306069 [Heterobasidion irregulare TC 32-1]ETW86472.1 hypothetical protein HETIRDRAFT_306069 [Heterobasidion irregulare TC 32-1]
MLRVCHVATMTCKLLSHLCHTTPLCEPQPCHSSARLFPVFISCHPLIKCLPPYVPTN